MKLENLLTELVQCDVTLTLAGDKLRLEAPAGMLTPELKAALAGHKAELVSLLEDDHAFCFNCMKKYGKDGRYQIHRAAISKEFPGWLEFTCARCGNKCYMKVKEETEHASHGGNKVAGLSDRSNIGRNALPAEGQPAHLGAWT